MKTNKNSSLNKNNLFQLKKIFLYYFTTYAYKHNKNKVQNILKSYLKKPYINILYF